jgi:eukaryotic-like serine/threonine-protein kinase
MCPWRNPADELSGLALENGWTVTSKVTPSDSATGGAFSVGYLVEHATGRRGFLKALDFSEAADPLADQPRELQRLTGEFNFERELLALCRDLRLSRIATAIEDGSVALSPETFGALYRVHYLIFELAEGDLRAILDSSADINLVWRFRMLRDVATGLKQLHGHGVAHQDLKPSNVLDYAVDGAKIGDLGRACARDRKGPSDEFFIAGDTAYAPPELLYGAVSSDWHVRRCGCDAYLLGGLVFFLFTRSSLTATIQANLVAAHTCREWKGIFRDAVPYVRQAFEAALADFAADATRQAGQNIGTELVAIVRQLCEPDPSLRGHPHTRANPATQFDLERYISRFDLFAARSRRPIPV